MHSRHNTLSIDRIAAATSKEAPAVVVRIVDEFCAELTPRARDIFLTRMGGYREPLTLAAIGDKYGITRERVRQLLVQPPLPEPLDCVKQILTEAERALTLQQILERAQQLWGEQAGFISVSRLTRALRAEDGVFLLGSDTYGLRRHIRLADDSWAKVCDDVYDLLQREGWSVSTFEMVDQPNLDRTRNVNPYELAAILQGDPRFAYLGRCLFTITTPKRMQPVPVTA